MIGGQTSSGETMKQFALVSALLISGISAQSMAQTSVSKAAWGNTADGHAVEIYVLQNKTLSVRITTFGARVVSIEAPDRSGVKADVVLGYKDVASYEADKNTYFGAIVGRYGNRIAKGAFAIDGKTFHVPLNNNGNSLHGGTVGFDHKVWSARVIPSGVEMTLISLDGDMGFPGELTAHVRYTLNADSLHIEYAATTTKPTVVNLTNHSYFNLGGEGRGTVLDEVLMISASHYAPVDAGLIPTGELATVKDTPFDFRTPTAIGERIRMANEQLKLASGYDHNFVLDEKSGEQLKLAARVLDPKSGRTLTVMTTEPGVQFYSGNFLDGTLTGSSGAKYVQHSGFALETQHFPDSPNEPKFPSTVLRPGKTMRSTTVFKFGVQQ
jgi:aldose 1-epimerase